jgi:hypothetical protein
VDELVVAGARAPISFPDPIPRAGDLGASLVAEARALLHTDAIPVILIEMADPGAFGLSRGVPGPPGASHRRAVLVDPTQDVLEQPRRAASRRARLAHVLGHQLGLHHPVETDVHGEIVDDGLSDTTRFDDTLMGSVLLGAPLAPSALRLTPEQAFAMTRSVLLE